MLRDSVKLSLSREATILASFLTVMAIFVFVAQYIFHIAYACHIIYDYM